MRRLILFAKRAVAGQVKTRLTPPLTPEQAVRLYRGFVADGVEFIRRFRDDGCGVERCTDRLWRNPLHQGVRTTAQGTGDLGTRMLGAFRRSAAEGAGCTVILGADAPTLPQSIVEQAFRRLESGADAVITPAEDGGYVLLGACGPLPELLRDIPWGTGRVLRETRSAAERHRIDLAETAGWYDVDRADDLHRLGRDLATAAGSLRAPRTLAALRAVWTPETGSC